MKLSCTHDTAVVILSYNGKKWHELFLPLIISEAKGQYEVIVIDNASTDDTLAYLQLNFPTVRTLQIAVNKGFANGYAEGLSQLNAKYFVLLSADFEVTKDWLKPLENAMNKDQNLGACQPKIRYWKEREKFEYAGAAGGFIDKWGYLFCRGRIFNDLEIDTHQYDEPIETFWASGGCLMVRAAAYQQVGGLDADFYAHMEEVDLCWRLKNAGYKIGVIPSSTVFHVGGSVISYGSPQKLFYNFRNNLILLLKNETVSKLLWLMPLRMILDGIAGLQFLLKGEFVSFKTIIKAHFSFYASLGKWLNHRKQAQKIITTKNKVGIYKKSILWQYFILKRKKFSQLNWSIKGLNY